MERVSRRRLLAAGSSAALASAVIGSGVAAAQGLRQPGLPLTEGIERYGLVLDPNSVRSARQATTGAGAPTGPVYYSGDIYKDTDMSGVTPTSGAGAVGRFRVTGWVYSGGAAPNTVGIGSFDFFGRGKVSLVGASGPVGSLAISGGTGEFEGQTGEARIAFLAPGNLSSLLVEFNYLQPTVGK
jgi:hypothetical protein